MLNIEWVTSTHSQKNICYFVHFFVNIFSTYLTGFFIEIQAF